MMKPQVNGGGQNRAQPEPSPHDPRPHDLHPRSREQATYQRKRAATPPYVQERCVDHGCWMTRPSGHDPPACDPVTRASCADRPRGQDLFHRASAEDGLR